MSAHKKTAKNKSAQQRGKGIWQKVLAPFRVLQGRVLGLLSRRPHRSFRRTMRRDYKRSLQLPGYWAFTNHVRVTLWRHRKLFVWLVVAYGILSVLLVGIASQDTYVQLSDALRQTSGEVFRGNWGELGKAGLLLVTGATGNFNGQLSESQQIYATILALFTWLTAVWLLRAVLAGHRPKLRDGVYNAGAPILPTMLVSLVLVVQLLPIVLAIIGFGAATATGLLSGGVEAMLFWTSAILLTALSLYWIASTFIALIVVTLPGMYPLQAIRTAGDIVIGRRVRILLRILWLLGTIALTWAIIMVPIILCDAWLKSLWPAIEWLPVVPVALLIMSTFTIVWAAAYIYLLYRKVVDDDAAPA